MTRDGLGRHENAGNVDTHHLVDIGSLILKRGRLLLNSCGGDEPVQAAMLGRDALYNAVEGVDIAYVDLVVCKRGREVAAGSEGDLFKFGVGCWEAVDGVDCGRGKSGKRQRSC